MEIPERPEIFNFPGNMEPVSNIHQRIKQATDEIVTLENIAGISEGVQRGYSLRKATAEVLYHIASGINVGGGSLKEATRARLDRLRGFLKITMEQFERQEQGIETPKKHSFDHTLAVAAFIFEPPGESLGSSFRFPAKEILELEEWRRENIHPASLYLAGKIRERTLGASQTFEQESQNSRKIFLFRNLWILTLNLGRIGKRKNLLSSSELESIAWYLEENAFPLLRKDPTGFSFLEQNWGGGTKPDDPFTLGVRAYKALYNAAVESGIPRDQKF